MERIMDETKEGIEYQQVGAIHQAKNTVSLIYFDLWSSEGNWTKFVNLVN